MYRRLQALLGRIRDAQQGIAAVEFALTAPILIIVYLGLAESCQALAAKRRIENAASVAAQLVSQAPQVSASALQDIFDGARQALAPYPTAPLRLRVSALVVDAAGRGVVQWSWVPQGQAGLAARVLDSSVSLPPGMAVNADTIVMAEVTYKYDSPINFFMPNLLQFSNTSYVRPRVNDAVSNG